LAKIILIGAGPGSREYVTPAARETVARASLVIGAERALELFREDIKGETCVLKADNFDELIQRALRFAREGRSVAFVSTGDPAFFGLLKPLLEKSPNGLEIDTVPGISSVQVATSRLQICSDEIGLFLSFHGRPDTGKSKLAEAIRNGKLAVVLPDPRSFPPDQIARYLIEVGIDPRTPAAVCENLTYPNEKVTEGDLLMLSSEKFGPMCIMVVGHWTRRRLRGSLQ
jgi:cobalt-precorrin-7 (C5)-methyltransferase